MPVMSQWDLIKTDDLYAENFLFNRHQAFTIGGEAEITPGIKYIKTPDSKMELGTKWPTLRIGYQRAVTGINGSDISYEKVSAGISKVHTMGLLGTFSWDVSGGTFLSNNVVALPDRQHFKGNRTFLRNAGLRQFHIMDYYSYATNDSWLEAHAQHAFGGFILNKIPLLKNLRLQEYVGLHFLWTEEYGEYLELQVGLEKRIIRGLLPLRFDFHYRMLGVSTPKWGITFTWPFGSDGQLSIGN